jgi:hypothetical protein
MIELPTGAERDFLNAFGACSIYICERPNVLRYAHDPKRAIDALRHKYSGLEPVFVTWTDGAAHARRLVRHVPRLTSDAIASTAEQLGITLTNHTVVMARAQSSVRRLDALLLQAKAQGQLKPFNRAYRAHRLAHGAIPYDWAFARLRRALALTLAQSGTIPWHDARFLRGSLGISLGRFDHDQKNSLTDTKLMGSLCGRDVGARALPRCCVQPELPPASRPIRDLLMTRRDDELRMPPALTPAMREAAERVPPSITIAEVPYFDRLYATLVEVARTEQRSQRGMSEGMAR